MVKKAKKYFSFFGVLCATANRKLLSSNSCIDSMLSKMPEITKKLLQKQLKPVKLYSTNNIKN